MVSVYFSHVGEIKTEQAVNVETVQAGTLKHILQELEQRHPGILPKVTDQTGERLNSATLIFKRIVVQGGRYLEGYQTAPVQTLDELISQEDENLLIAFFHPERIVSFLLDTLTSTEDRFDTGNGTHKYRAYISSSEDKLGSQSLFAQSEPEALYPFTSGRPISELVAVDGLLDSSRNKLISPSLRDAIARLWEVDADFRLRLFQEDALVHIIRELTKAEDSARQPLLLSIPTGGGKTEAFLVPLISHLHNQREKELRAGRIPSNRVRSMIIYPTRALANDQARRIAEILFLLNEGAIEDRKISVGVLTGDTPNSGYNLGTEKSLLQLCPRCSAALTNFPDKEMQEENGKLFIARCVCGAEIDFFRLTRQDILKYPPDILITSPDMINRMLQSPRYHKHIFSKAIDLVVFDEIHMYNSVFGCNIAHLLRRFEEACERKPMYVGVSATIRNARELASLIFDAEAQKVKYFRPRRREEDETEEKRLYLDYESLPTRYRYHYAIAPVMLSKEKQQKVITSVLNVADVIGHLLRDPHFRKTIIFSNFRQDTDDIVRYLRDQEDRYYSTYHTKLFPRLLTRGIAAQSSDYKPFTKIEADIISAVDRWYRHAYELGALYDEKLEIGWHRGGLERDERIKSVNRFSSAKLLHTSDDGTTALPIDLMVATSTLELGIDIGDVTTVINSGAPFTANEYTQRVGRGGRRKDSLALTVVDTRNPLDFYFLKHFWQYAHPTVDDFEDAPIIISNEAVLKSHIYARLLDRLAYYLEATEKEEIQVSDLRNLRLSVNGRTYTYQEDYEEIEEVLFQEIFTRQRVAALQDWIKQEARIIPDICETEITFEDIHTWWQGKWQQLYNQISSANGDMQDNDHLSGMAAKDRELVPDLRSSGPSVGMYLIREGSNDDLRDTISRRQAISSRPVGGYASQGSVTFKIDTIKENDHSAEERIKELFLTSADNEAAARYFSRMFGDASNRSPFPDKPINVVIKTQFETPKDLAVKYNPYRFYCPHCGATYSDKRAGDERCTYCRSELRQLTEVYMCGGCGKLFQPPVPKVCVNPACIEQARSSKDNSSFVAEGYKRVGKGDRHNEYFRFRALPMLTWQCRRCGTEVNYHAYHELDQAIVKQIDHVPFGMNTPQQMAKTFLQRPESWFGKTYDKDGFEPARFVCKDCKASGKYKKIHVKNIPTFRSAVQEYIIVKGEIMPRLIIFAGSLDFKYVSIVELAREFYRRFYSYSERDSLIDIEPIFPNTNRYLANTSDTHAVFFGFDEMLQRFLMTHPQAHECHEGNSQCACRQQKTTTYNEANEEERESTGPKPELLSWERGRKPDPRRKWCRVVQNLVPGKVCPGEQQFCPDCPHFEPQRHLKYLILHTLEHAIIAAMPKYTGINKNQIREIVYPNDTSDYDCALIDSTVGGSGSFYLLRKNWQQIWQMVGEILEAAQDEPEQLVLPYTCFRYNRDLCPQLAFAFYQYANQQGGV